MNGLDCDEKLEPSMNKSPCLVVTGVFEVDWGRLNYKMGIFMDFIYH